MKALIQQKINKIKECILTYKSALIAVSGGVSSSLVLHYAQKYLGVENVKAAILVSPVFAADEQLRVEEICTMYGIELIRQEVDILSIPEIRENSEDCYYHLQKSNFTNLKKLAADHQLEAVFAGYNLTDDPEKVKGIRAADELEIINPLRTSGILEKDVSLLAQLCSIYSWCYASNSCYITRFPKGTEPTLERIRKINDAEMFVKNYLPYSKLKIKENPAGDEVSIETADHMLEALVKNKGKIVSYLETLGYRKIYIDLNPWQAPIVNSDVNSDANSDVNSDE